MTSPSADRLGIPPKVIKEALNALAAIRSHAKRAPFPNPDRVAQHGERAVVMSSFAMIRGMADEAIERIKETTGYSPDPDDC
jgi:hypothetical protein